MNRVKQTEGGPRSSGTSVLVLLSFKAGIASQDEEIFLFYEYLENSFFKLNI